MLIGRSALLLRRTLVPVGVVAPVWSRVSVLRSGVLLTVIARLWRFIPVDSCVAPINRIGIAAVSRYRSAFIRIRAVDTIFWTVKAFYVIA